MATDTAVPRRRSQPVLAAALAPAAAIAVFGVIYGSIAQPLMGAGPAMLSSLLIFSGSVQFTVAGLLSVGAGSAAIVLGSTTLNLRNLVLGAVLRARVKESRARRAGLAWFLVDESVGLALASEAQPARTLVTSGTLFYLAWQLGTVLGLLGATVEGVRSAAEAVFPALFIGLAAVTCFSRAVAVRSVLAATFAALGALKWPEGRAVVAVIAAIASALPGRNE
jgi:predicted branched-subunit amino acid permease